MARNLYILSHPRVVGEYKIGIHGKCLSSLHRRYKTVIPQVQVHYFIQNINARELEKTFLAKYADHRIHFADSKRASEWVKVSFDAIEKDIGKLIAEMGPFQQFKKANTLILVAEKYAGEI